MLGLLFCNKNKVGNYNPFYNQNEPSSYYSKEMCRNKGKTENTGDLHLFLRIEFQKKT